MRDAFEIIHEAGDAGERWALHMLSGAAQTVELRDLKNEIIADRADAYTFALALALLTWLHGSQEPDARAELDAWMRAGIAVTGATGDDGRVRVRQAEEGECVVGYTFVDDAADFNPLTPEESAAINANSRAISAGPVNISAAFFQRPKAKP